jgi:hypothetical protein
MQGLFVRKLKSGKFGVVAVYGVVTSVNCGLAALSSQLLLKIWSDALT